MSKKPAGVARGYVEDLLRNLTQSQPKSQNCSRKVVLRGALIIVIITVIATLSACAGNKESSSTLVNSTSWGAERFVTASRGSAHAAMTELDKGKSKENAEHGIEFAERCLMMSPENAGCYYWRAVNTGLYYKVHVIGYQRGVKQMIDDCHKVISYDRHYDHGGAYRILGQIYTQLPQTGGTADSVTRDLDFAEKNLRQAIRIAPDYPENYVALAETLLAKEKFSDAVEAIVQAKGLVPHWKNDISYNEWNKSVFALEKKINKVAK